MTEPNGLCYPYASRDAYSVITEAITELARLRGLSLEGRRGAANRLQLVASLAIEISLERTVTVDVLRKANATWAEIATLSGEREAAVVARFGDSASLAGTTGPVVPAGAPGPSCHDGVAMRACAACGDPFIVSGRRRHCSDACRAVAYRRRRDAGRQPVELPKAKSRRPITVYECEGCGVRQIGSQSCEECHRFMRRAGAGGACPSCEEVVTVQELLDD